MVKKTYSKTGRICRVTFDVPAEFEASNAAVVGEFNAWNPDATPMKRRKNGSYTATVSLEPGREYRFRYRLDEDRWENDPAADAYVHNHFGSQDSIVKV